MNFLERIACRFLTKRFLKGYGPACPDYNRDCIQCRANEVRLFLEEHIELTRG